MATFTFTGSSLDLETLSALIQGQQNPELSDEVLGGAPAAPADFPAGALDLARGYLQAQVLSYGPETEERIIRLALLLLIQSQLGGAGTAPAQKGVLQRLLAYHNREVFPVVLRHGTEAARLAQLCQPLLLAGKVRFQGYPLKAADVSEMFSWSALPLSAAEVQALLARPVFSWAHSADMLLQLKPLLNWFIYFDAVFGRLLPDSNAGLHRALQQVLQHLGASQQALEQEINGQAGLPLPAALASLAASLQEALHHLVQLNQVLLEGLETMVEPPATATFALAIQTGQLLDWQASRPLNPGAEALAATVLTEHLGALAALSHTLASLVFWSFLQADVISGDFLESSTLQAYQQAGLFVPEETVNEQLEKISDFIQKHFPVGAA